jgi:hypothetical protein
MRIFATFLAGAILVFTAWPAAAPLLCPDETGAYTPDACDLILPIEPNPGAIQCDIVDHLAGTADPICERYWKREAAAEEWRWAVLAALRWQAEVERIKRELIEPPLD